MYRKFFKRVIDLFFSVILLIVLLFPLVIVAIIIKLTSNGPVLFIQERYGKNSHPFNLYKFRSMVDEAPEVANSEFDDIKSYVTPFGMFIRKTSIDELPQLWNIIKGNMSFIGPRPLAITDKKVISIRQQNGGDSVLPGISGLAQVSGRNNLTDEEKAFYDGKYAASVSFHVDVLLVIETIFSVLKRDGIFKENLVEETNNLGQERGKSEQKSVNVSSKS